MIDAEIHSIFSNRTNVAGDELFNSGIIRGSVGLLDSTVPDIHIAIHCGHFEIFMCRVSM